MSFARSFKEIFRSAFLELSFWKLWLLRISILLLLAGSGFMAYSAYSQGGEFASEGWSLSALTSGAGCILGFLVGAAFRVFLKLAVLLGLLAAGVLYGLNSVGWIELPWSSFSEIAAATQDFVQQQSGSLQDALTGWLPSSAMTGLGLFSGVTQRPDLDPEH